VPNTDLSLGDDLRAFVDAAPSPFHAVAELARRLTAAGFTELAETDRWELGSGAEHFVIRSGSLIAFRVRPRSDVRQAGYRLFGVEP
jgi:aspartyl aminopeptidase